MQATVTSNDSIKLTVNASELSLISYALSYFGHSASTKYVLAGDLEDAKKLGEDLFHVHTIVTDDSAYEPVKE